MYSTSTTIDGVEYEEYVEQDVIHDLPYLIENNIVVTGLEHWVESIEEYYNLEDNKEILKLILNVIELNKVI